MEVCVNVDNGWCWWAFSDEWSDCVDFLIWLCENGQFFYFVMLIGIAFKMGGVPWCRSYP